MASRILVVDDDPDARAICGSLLSHFGYDVILADDGIEGVDLAHREEPELILMDIMMPGVSGFTAVDVLRRSVRTREIPVVAMSLYDPHPEEIRQAGFDGFLPKPFSPHELIDVVDRWV